MQIILWCGEEKNVFNGKQSWGHGKHELGVSGGLFNFFQSFRIPSKNILTIV